MNKTALIYKVLSGAASLEERRALNVWIALNEGNKTEFEDIRLLWDASHDPDQSIEDHVEDGLARIKTALHSRREKKQIALVFIALMTVGISSMLVMRPDKADNGHLAFSNTPLTEVIRVIENKYQVKIDLQKDIKAYLFTGVFYQINDVEEVLSTLEKALHLHHQRSANGQYVLSASACSGK